MNNLQWFKAVFLKYLRKAKAAKLSFADFIAAMFRTKTRTIDTLKCLEAHELRGAVWIDSKPVEGLIDRRVLKMKAGQIAWLRQDDGENFVTLENARGCVNIKKDDWNAKYRKYYSSGH